MIRDAQLNIDKYPEDKKMALDSMTQCAKKILETLNINRYLLDVEGIAFIKNISNINIPAVDLSEFIVEDFFVVPEKIEEDPEKDESKELLDLKFKDITEEIKRTEISIQTQIGAGTVVIRPDYKSELVSIKKDVSNIPKNKEDKLKPVSGFFDVMGSLFSSSEKPNTNEKGWFIF